MQIDIPAPKYPIGAIVVALINHQARYARLEQAHMVAHFVMNDRGLMIENRPRWEYDARVFNDPLDESEMMVISERTIIKQVETDSG